MRTKRGIEHKFIILSMPEDSQAQPDSSQVPPPVEQAAPVLETPMPTVAESAVPTEPTHAPSEPIADVPLKTPDSSSAPKTTAQIPANEPLSPKPMESAPPPTEPFVPPREPQPAPSAPVSLPTSVSLPSATESPHPSPQSLLAKALTAIQFRKKAKLEKIMKLAQEKRSITNDQVQKLLRVSDATATRYLSELVRQTRLRRLGANGSTRYEPFNGSIPTI